MSENEAVSETGNRDHGMNSNHPESPSDTVAESELAPTGTNESAAVDDLQDDDTKAQNAEAAKYRRKLREAEAELESVTARLDAVQRQQVESMLGKSGVKPEAVFAVTSLADLLGEDGAVDATKLNAAVATATEKFGIVKPPKGTHVPGVGNRPDAMPKADGWKEAFAPSNRR